MKKIMLSCLLMATISIALMSCSDPSIQSSTSTTHVNAQQVTPTPKPVDGYIRVTEDSVRFLKWTENNGEITGLWSTATVTDGKAVYMNGMLSGSRNNDQISLTMHSGLSTSSATGINKDDTLTLQTPGKDGTISTVIYKGCSIAEYNQAIENFKKKYPLTATE